MRKAFKLEGIDCANCAAKMETKIKHIEGVENASVNFMTQKLTLQAADDAFERVLAEVAELVERTEPDWELIR